MAESENEVLAYCGACKMDLIATIVAKSGAKIAKVQCNTCKKERAFKAPKGVSEPGATPTATAATRKRKEKAAVTEAAKAVSVEAEWQRLMGESAKAARVKYSPKAKLNLGDVVQHPTFGEGVVTRVIHPDKVDIIFKTDLKMLIHSRN
jgi:hypothetical protein